ncbi:MAG: spirocyclase AveC family protein [Mycobacterium sp.]
MGLAANHDASQWSGFPNVVCLDHTGVYGRRHRQYRAVWTGDSMVELSNDRLSGAGEVKLGLRDSPPIVWLARLGVLFLALEVYVFARWVASSDFVATPTGNDPLSGSQLVWIRIWEVLSVVGSIAFVWWIVRKTRRDRAFPVIGIVMVAWMLTAWQDPGVNDIRPTFAYNSHFFNRGTWAHFIPGWGNEPGANPQPIFFWIATYLLFFPLAALVTSATIDAVRRVLPQLNRAGIVAAFFLFGVLEDILIEQLWLHQGLYAYMRVNHSWSLFPGSITQLPLYEPLVFGGLMMMTASLTYYFRDHRGRMVTDRGIDKLTARRTLPLIRALALGAMLNIAMLAFNFGFNMANQHADTMPTSVPSYFSNGLCGVGADAPCIPPT